MNRLFADQAGTFYTQSTNQINRMHGSTMRILCWSFCISLLSMAAPSVADDNTNDDWLSAPLVQLVREATMQYRDVEVAEGDGYVGDPFCVSGGAGGATGVHYVKSALIGDGVVNVATPEILIYQPGRYRMQLVAVEYLVFADAPVALEGHLLHLAGTPNRFGIPAAFLELHVWAWKRNPNGNVADFNPHVSCDALPLD